MNAWDLTWHLKSDESRKYDLMNRRILTSHQVIGIGMCLIRKSVN
jgi:hypothetical protein